MRLCFGCETLVIGWPHQFESFMYYYLGYFDLDTRVLEPLENPFGPRLFPM